MSLPLVSEPALRPRGRELLRTWAAVAAAGMLGLARPATIVRVLRRCGRGATPATALEASRARASVCGTSARCAGRGCLQRSLAVVLLCRMRGTAPTWRCGYRIEPFLGHAWVEADGRPVDEPAEVPGYTVVLEVPPPIVPAAAVPE